MKRERRFASVDIDKQSFQGGSGKEEALKRVPMTESSFIHGIFKKRFRANKSSGEELVVVTRSRIKLMAIRQNLKKIKGRLF